MELDDPVAQLKGHVNDCLPPGYASQIGEEAAAQLKQIKADLTVASALLDIKTSKGLFHKLTLFLKLKYPLSVDDSTFIVEKLLAFVNSSEVDMHSQTKALTACAMLLTKRKDLKLQIDWKPLYDRLAALQTQSRSLGFAGKQIRGFHSSALVQFAHSARRYFSADAAERIFAQVRPQFNPHDSNIFHAQSLLCLLAPMQRNEAFWADRVDELLAMWSWIEHSPEWDSQFAALFARLAKVRALNAAAGGRDWTQAQISVLFSNALRMLDLALGSTNLPKPNGRSASTLTSLLTLKDLQRWRKIAKLIVYLLRPNSVPESESALGYFRELISSISSYYHPSNGGAWSTRLSLLLRGLAEYFSKRYAKEILPNSEFVSSAKLTDSDRDLFIDTLLPIIATAQYAKGTDLQMSAEQALKHLSYIRPKKAFPFQLERIANALSGENLTFTHATYSALETLAVIAHPLFNSQVYPEGVKYLADILMASLPGIDSNDQMKTNATMKFYFALLSNVPLLDLSGGDTVMTSDDESSAAATNATSIFEQWALEFLARVLSMLEQKDKPEKKTSARITDEIFGRTTSLLFMQMSESIHDIATRRLLQWVKENNTPNAVSQVRHLVGAAMVARPAKTLQLFVPYYVSKVIEKDGSLSSSSDADLEWSMSILEGVCFRCGSTLLPYLDSLRKVIDATARDPRADLTKRSAVLNATVVNSLVTIYPLEYFSVATRNEDDLRKRGWNEWGRWYTYKSLNVQWHEPSDEEMSAAAKFLHDSLSYPIEKLKSILQTNTQSVSKEQMLSVLMSLRGSIGAAAAFAPEVIKNATPTANWSPTYVTVRSPRVKVPESMNNFREEIQSLMHQVFEYLMEYRRDDVAVWTSFIKAVTLLLNHRGQSREQLKTSENLFKIFRDKFAQLIPKPAVHSRALRVERIYLQHLRRMAELTSVIPHNNSAQQLIDDLVKLSLNQFPIIRQSAQGAVAVSLKNYGRASRDIIIYMLDRLPKKENTDEEVLGCVAMLKSKTILKKIAHDWRLSSQFVHAFLKTYVHDKVTLQSQLFSLFGEFCKQTFPLPLRAITIATAPQGVDQKAFENSANSAKSNSEKNQQTYFEIISHVTELLNTQKSLHWRYVLLGSGVLFLLVRPDMETPSGVLDRFLKCLVSDIFQLRTLAVKAVYCLLKQPQLRTQLGSPIVSQAPHFPVGKFLHPVEDLHVYDAQPISTEAQWNTTHFVDKNYFGWNGVPEKVSVKAPSQRVAPAGLLPLLTSSSFLESLLRHQTHDHRGKAEGQEGEGASSHAAAAKAALKAAAATLGFSLGIDLDSFLGKVGGGGGGFSSGGGMGLSGASSSAEESAREFVELLAGDFSAWAKKWPKTKNPLGGKTGEGFQENYARLWHRFFQCFEDSLLEPLRPHLLSLLANTSEKGAQTTASEILAGLIRASAKWKNFEKHQRGSAFVRELLDHQLIQKAAISFDAIIDWGNALRFAVYDLDARRIRWLIDLLQTNVLSPHAPSALQESKRLFFVRIVFSELSWRAAPLAPHLLNYLFPHLAHPYKQVRTEIAALIITLFESLWSPARIEALSNAYVTMTKQDPPSHLLESFVSHLAEKLDSLTSQIDLLTSSSVSGGEGGAERLKSFTDERSHIRDTVSQTIRFGLNRAFSFAIMPYFIPLLKVVFDIPTDPDQELSRESKATLAYVSQALLPPAMIVSGGRVTEGKASLPILSAQLERISTSPHWHERGALLPFLQIFSFNHLFVLRDQSALYSTAVKLLSDSQLEVRELAAVALASMFKRLTARSDTIDAIGSFVKTFADLANTPMPKGTGADITRGYVRHGGVLGLSALVLSSPYTVPTWMPKVLVRLSVHLSDPVPLQTSVKKTFAEFWRTHSDTWHLEKSKFNEDEIFAIQQLISPNYYA